MIKVAAKLAVITVLAAAGVHFGYRYLEKKMQASSCLPEPPKNGQAAANALQPAIETPDGLMPSAAAQDFQIIVRRDLFKTVPPPTVAEEKKPEPSQPQVVPTTLNLTLAGTVTGTAETARAIIVNNAGKDRKQQLLQIGAPVKDTAAVIKTIAWNKIELDVNGKLEVLEMPKPKSASGSGPAAAMNPPALPAQDIISPSEAAETQAGQPVRPNRRINLPEPEQPTELAADELPPGIDPTPPTELPVEVPVPELPQIEEPPPADVQ
jgi:type II secretory pathway component PulC